MHNCKMLLSAADNRYIVYVKWYMFEHFRLKLKI